MEYIEKPKAPCAQSCPYRGPFCRLDCDEYIEYEEKYKIYRKLKQKKIEANNDYGNYRKMLDAKIKRRKRRHG